ncbi:MAG: phosphomannomutase/phosphoglucomutase [Thermodesulfobacteriota bacterium]
MRPVKPDTFRAYDIRGVVDKDFDPEWVEDLGRACGSYFKRKGFHQAVVGRDNRQTSAEYQARMVEGLMSTGIDCVFLPMVPTPVFYYAVRSLNRRAGVMITASHNPPEFNGFKVWAGSNTIHSDEIQNLYRIMKERDFEKGQGLASELDIVPSYLEELSRQTRLENPVKVVVDGGNGSAGLVCAELLRRIGAEVIELFCEPDPDFPNHHPDPTVLENIKDMQRLVQEQRAHLGIGLDGDGDRIGVVDHLGRIIYGDKLLALYARQVLAQSPGATVIGEVKCTHLLFQDIAEHGGKPLMWKTGHSLIKAKMQETGALLAGEMSGHMFFADRYYGYDDALYAAQRLVELVDREPEKSLEQYFSAWPETVNTPEIRKDCPDAVKFAVIDKAQDYFRQQSGDFELVDVDGIRINFSDGWGLLRASNTQPVLVLRFEAETENRLREIRSYIEEPLDRWIQDLSR